MADASETIEEVLANLGVPVGDTVTVDDLVAGLNASRRLRENNSRWGGMLVAALRAPGPDRLSWHQIFVRTGIKRGRALGWSRPPG